MVLYMFSRLQLHCSVGSVIPCSYYFRVNGIAFIRNSFEGEIAPIEKVKTRCHKTSKGLAKKKDQTKISQSEGIQIVVKLIHSRKDMNIKPFGHQKQMKFYQLNKTQMDEYVVCVKNNNEIEGHLPIERLEILRKLCFTFYDQMNLVVVL